MSERRPELGRRCRRVVAEASPPPEGEPLALREAWSGETRDQRLSSLATGVHLAPGDLTHQNQCILRAVATQATAQQGASLIGPPPTSLNGELPPDFLLLVTCLWIEHLA